MNDFDDSKAIFIDPRIGTDLNLLTADIIFEIRVNNKKYQCNIYAVRSSDVIRDILDTNPDVRHYDYKFGGNIEYFQLVCDFFNFKGLEITSENFNSLKEIATNLKIAPILAKINKFAESNAQFDREFNLIEDIFSSLYNIKELTVQKVKEQILNSIWIESPKRIKNFVAFLLQVVRSGFYLQRYLVDLVLSLDQASTESNNLKMLKPFLCNHLLNYFHENQFYCCFIYHLSKRGFISIDYILNQIILFDDCFVLTKGDYKPIIKPSSKKQSGGWSKSSNSVWGSNSSNSGWGSNSSNSGCGNSTPSEWVTSTRRKVDTSSLGEGPISKGKWNSLSSSRTKGASTWPTKSASSNNSSVPFFHTSVIIWFYAELNESKRTIPPAIFDQLPSLDKFYNFINHSFHEYKTIRDSFEPKSEILKAILQDDVNSLQLIIAQRSIKIRSFQIPYELYEPSESSPNTLLNFAAQCGSIECFKYLLLNQAIIDEFTAGYAVYGGNIEIVRLIEQNSPCRFNVKNIVKENNQNDQFPVYYTTKYFLFDSSTFKSPLLISIVMHRNKIFDWILEHYNDPLNSTEIYEIAFASVKSCNIHSFLYCIEKGFNFNNDPKCWILFLEISASLGYYKLTDFIIPLRTQNKQLTLYNSIISFNDLEISKLFFDYENCQFDPKGLLDFAVDRGYVSIIQFLLDTCITQPDKFYIKQLVNLAFNDQLALSFNFLQNRFNLLNANNQLGFTVSEFSDFLVKCCSKRNFLIFQKLFEFYFSHFKYSETQLDSIFLEACYSGCEKIVELMLSKKIKIDSRSIIDHYQRIFKANCGIAILLINLIDPAMQTSFTDLLIKETIITKNKNAFTLLLSKPTNFNNLIFQALQFHDVNIIKTIITHNPESLNKLSREGTALNIAMKQNDLDIVNFLSSIPETDINMSYGLDKTPLLLAVENNWTEILSVILNHPKFDFVRSKLDHAFFISNNNEILQMLYSNEHLDINYTCEIFLDNKQNISSCQSNLNHAIFQKNQKKCELIITHPKFDPYKSNAQIALTSFIKFKQFDLFEKLILISSNCIPSILSVLIDNHSIDLIKFVLEHFPQSVNLIYNKGTHLHNAIANKDIDLVKSLISIPAIDINICNFDNETPLTLATELNLPNVVSILMNHSKFDPKKSNIDYAFFICNNNDILKMLYSNQNLNVNYQYDVTIKSETEIPFNVMDTSLINAIRQNNLYKVDLIISHPKFNALQSDAKNAIFNMIDESEVQLFEKLIRIINDASFCSYSGQKFLPFLAQNHKFYLLNVVFSLPDLVIEDDHLISLFLELLTIQYTPVEFLRGLIQYDEAVNHCFDYHHLLSNGKSYFTHVNSNNPSIGQIVQLLLKQGVDPNAPDSINFYPLEYAIKSQSMEYIQALIDSKLIDYTTKLSDNNTYLHVAAKASSIIYNKILDLNQANVNERNDSQMTPSDLLSNQTTCTNTWGCKS